MQLPTQLGTYDITVIGAVLLHSHDPIGILLSCASRTTETIVVTELRSVPDGPDRRGEPIAVLYPSQENQVASRWWTFSPEFFVQLLGVLGYVDARVEYHEQHYVDIGMTDHPWYTVVASRAGTAEAERSRRDRRRGRSGRIVDPADGAPPGTGPGVTRPSTLSASGDRAEQATDDLERLRRRVDELPWFHHIDLGNGIVTPGADGDSAEKVRNMHLPEDLAGKTVLDVGAWDGLCSFYAEEQGAARVLATDSYSWGGGGWGSKECFELARAARRSRVEDLTIDVMDLSPEALGGRFDVVFFLGVLYHLQDPLLGLQRVASVVGELLVCNTHLALSDIDGPALRFYPGAELEGDPTNWWAPNASGLEAMLRSVGFRHIETIVIHEDPQGRDRGTAEATGTFYAWR